MQSGCRGTSGRSRNLSSAPVLGIDVRRTDSFRTRHTKPKFAPVSRCQAVLSKSKWCSDHDLRHLKSGLSTSSRNRRYGDLPTAGFSQRRSPTVRGFPQPDAPLASPRYSSLRSVFFSSDPCQDGAAVRSVSFGARTAGWFDIGQLVRATGRRDPMCRRNAGAEISLQTSREAVGGRVVIVRACVRSSTANGAGQCWLGRTRYAEQPNAKERGRVVDQGEKYSGIQGVIKVEQADPSAYRCCGSLVVIESGPRACLG
jgi:hypothetical protein